MSNATNIFAMLTSKGFKIGDELSSGPRRVERIKNKNGIQQYAITGGSRVGYKCGAVMATSYLLGQLD